MTLVTSLLLAVAPARAQDLTDRELSQWTRYIMDLERRVSRSSDDPRLMLRLAAAYVQVGDLRRAGPALERLADLEVSPVIILLLRGDLYARVGEYDQAVRAYLDVLSRSPHQPYALARLWEVMLRVTVEGAEVGFDRESVIHTLQQAGLYFPEYYRPEPDGPEQAARHLDRARALLMRDRPDDAVVELTRAIDLDPGNADAFAALVRVYRTLHDDESAMGAALVYLVLAPDAADAPRMRRLVGRVIEESHLR